MRRGGYTPLKRGRVTGEFSDLGWSFPLSPPPPLTPQPHELVWDLSNVGMLAAVHVPALCTVDPMPVHPDYPDPHLIPDDLAFEHVCEVCGKTALLTSADAYNAGWDYPPQMYRWGAVSPRTCEHCGMDETAWWALVVGKKPAEELTAEQRKSITRIFNEIPG